MKIPGRNNRQGTLFLIIKNTTLLGATNNVVKKKDFTTVIKKKFRFTYSELNFIYFL